MVDGTDPFCPCPGTFMAQGSVQNMALFGVKTELLWPEMEKAYKIAQMKILDPKNSTKNAYFASYFNLRQNSVISTIAHHFLAQQFFTVLKAQF